MGRPSKLTDKQWGEIGRRLASGEPTNALAREYKVSKATVSERFSNKVEQIKTLAEQIVSTDRALAALPVSEQCSVISLVDQMKGIQNDYAKAAARSTKTAVKFADLAGRIADGLELSDDGTADKGMLEQAGVAVELTKATNQAASLASNLIAANKPEKQGPAGGLESIIDGSWGGK